MVENRVTETYPCAQLKLRQQLTVWLMGHLQRFDFSTTMDILASQPERIQKISLCNILAKAEKEV